MEKYIIITVSGMHFDFDTREFRYNEIGAYSNNDTESCIQFIRIARRFTTSEVPDYRALYETDEQETYTFPFRNIQVLKRISKEPITKETKVGELQPW